MAEIEPVLPRIGSVSTDGNQSTPEPSSPYTPLVRGRKKHTEETKNLSTTPPLRVGSATTDDLVQPKVYSAIGSLESSSLSTSFQKRIMKVNNSKPRVVKSGGFPERLISPTTTTTTTFIPPHGFTTTTTTRSIDTKPASTTWSTAVTFQSTNGVQESKSTTPPTPGAGLTSALESHAAATAAAAKAASLNQKEPRVCNKGHVEEKKMSGTVDEGQSSSLDSNTGTGGILKKRLSFPRLNNSSSEKTVKNASFSKDVAVIPAGEFFRPSCDAYTPRIQSRSKIPKYVDPESRRPVEAGTMGTISRPNFRDALKRVAMILHQHITKIERRFDDSSSSASMGSSSVVKSSRSLFSPEMRDLYSEDNYTLPRYKCTLIPTPIPGGIYIHKQQIPRNYTMPSTDEIYEFAHQLFKRVQLSSECSIVCLIYVERLMEVAKVPLLAKTWRPIFMCGLLLASKVWQDLSSWNIEFASVYPQFSLEAINRLELQFVSHIKWDLCISPSLYAKYYFALRSLLEKKDFRRRYNSMVGKVDSVAESEALKVAQRTEVVKEEALLLLSRSM